MDERFHHPFTSVVAGPTSCGKTELVAKFIQHMKQMITPSPQRIVWCYAEWQRCFDSAPNVGFIEGLPQRENFDGTQSTLLILDDLMNETNQSVTDLFTKGSHHRDLSVVYIVQNLFNNGKEHCAISLYSHYIVVFKNPRNASQIIHLAKQTYPGKVKAVQEAFKDATSAPFGYLLLDFKQCTPDKLRLRTKVFPDETTVVYVPF